MVICQDLVYTLYTICWYRTLGCRFNLSSTKVIVQSLRGSPGGYRHDILIKSTSRADYITQESKCNHSQGSRIIQAWIAKKPPVRQTKMKCPFWVFFFSFLTWFCFNISLHWREIRAVANCKGKSSGASFVYWFLFTWSQTSGTEREKGGFYTAVHMEGPLSRPQWNQLILWSWEEMF